MIYANISKNFLGEFHLLYKIYCTKELSTKLSRRLFGVDSELRLSEIADTLQLNHATCANILKTLVNRNYVEQIKSKKGYKLGYMLYQLTDIESFDTELLSVAEMPMKKLNEAINERIILSAIKNDKRLLLKELPCNHEVQVKTINEMSVYRATTGRMILAYYSQEELDSFVRRVGMPSESDWPEVKTGSELAHILRDIRNEQFVISHNKNHVVGLATPIFKNNRVIASLGIYLPDVRFDNTEKEKIIHALKLATDQINDELKFPPFLSSSIQK